MNTLSSNPSIFKQKFTIPPFGPEKISRKHLLNQLKQAFNKQTKLILLCAPAGYGKTTLISEWVHEMIASLDNSTHFGYFGLDIYDNSFAAFSYSNG